MSKKPTPAQLKSQCDNWNKNHPEGTAVSLLKDSGEVMITKTRSPAQLLSGHSAVIWLEGVSGCYLLSRVKPLQNPFRTNIGYRDASEAIDAESRKRRVAEFTLDQCEQALRLPDLQKSVAAAIHQRQKLLSKEVVVAR